jgi:peroxiredoxin
MPPVPSQMIPLGAEAPAFALPVVNPSADGRSGETRTLQDYAEAEALVVAFLCNHCPYVVAIEDRLLALAREMAPRGVQFVGVCSNDAERYPDDAPEALAERAREKAYPFPYLHDPEQEAARAYDAACTPDFFVYDRDRRLAYRGRLDDGRPGREPTTADLRETLEELLSTGEVSREQYPSIGCSIKWREG